MVGRGRKHDHRYSRISRPPDLQGRDSGQPRQIQVKQNEIGLRALSSEYQPALAVLRHVDRRLGLQTTQDVAYRLLNERVVIDDQCSHVGAFWASPKGRALSRQMSGMSRQISRLVACARFRNHQFSGRARRAMPIGAILLRHVRGQTPLVLLPPSAILVTRPAWALRDGIEKEKGGTFVG